jgi:uncharacterized protein YdhG (YjbR/CyaY superfamily)
MRGRTPAKSRKPATVDEYLAAVPDDQQRAALQKLRRTIKTAFPRAEECVSYGLPAFRYEGRMIAWYGAAKHHCSFYPGGVVDACKDDLTKYETSKGTIRFSPDAPLPATLVKKLLKARIAVNARRASRS